MPVSISSIKTASCLNLTNLSNLPNHLIFDKEKLIGKINSVILREDVNIQINELLIVEFYSRK